MKELPSDTLANGAEGIKGLITNFDDAYVGTAAYIADICSPPYTVAANRISRTNICRQHYTTRTLRKAEQ